MKTATEVIEHLKTLDIKISLSGKNIRYEGPIGSLTPELKDLLRHHKTEILSYLNQEVCQLARPGMVIKRGEGDFMQVYRPCRISEMVGNETGKKIIQTAFLDGSLPHTLLIHGMSGTGKTTMARIIEMGLICKNGPTSEPCCECTRCQSIINKKGNLSVLELNAVEKLKDDLKQILNNFYCYGLGQIGGHPNSILLIDECHGLTKDQAQLFLKYMEDVPAENYFIFCTTEYDNVLPTLRDRCVARLKFQAVAADDILFLLNGICAQEKIESDEEVLKQIVQVSGGKPRLAVNELQQRLYAGDLRKYGA